MTDNIDAAWQRSVLVVEDDALLRELVASFLESKGFVVETAANASDARRVFERGDHDALVLDVELGPGPNGFDLAHALLAKSPHTAVLFLTNVPDPRFVEVDPQGLPRGIAYLRKSSLGDVHTLLAALEAALRGSGVDRFRDDLDPQRPAARLTRKQVSVLRLAALGHTNAQIAQERGVSVKAVEDTMSRACLALGVNESGGNLRVAAVRRYLELTGAPALADDAVVSSQ